MSTEQRLRLILGGIAHDREAATENLKDGYLGWLDDYGEGYGYNGDNPEKLPKHFGVGWGLLVDERANVGPGVVLRDADDAPVAAAHLDYLDCLKLGTWLADTGYRLANRVAATKAMGGVHPVVFEHVRKHLVEELLIDDVKRYRREMRAEIEEQLKVDMHAAAVGAAEKARSEALTEHKANIRDLATAAACADPGDRDRILSDLRPWLQKVLSS